MSYIKQLQQENEDLRKAKHIVNEKINSFMAHLMSEKYWIDSTIQTSDVLSRLENMK